MKMKGWTYNWKRDGTGDWVSDNGKWRVQRIESRLWRLWRRADESAELHPCRLYESLREAATDAEFFDTRPAEVQWDDAEGDDAEFFAELRQALNE